MAGSRFAVLLVSLYLASVGSAQQNNLAVSFGATVSPSVTNLSACEAIPVCPTTPVDHAVTPGFTIEGTYARRLADFRLASLHVELPVMFSPTRNAGFTLFSGDFSTLFFTPSLRLRLLPSSGVSPFLSAGGGLAYFRESSTSDTRGAFQVGGGLDFKTRLPLLGFRIEARDFITGSSGATSFTSLSGGHLHSIFLGAGVTLHF
jgi:hypothetical protein